MNEKVINAMIRAIAAQREAALNTAAGLQAQLDVTAEALRESEEARAAQDAALTDLRAQLETLRETERRLSALCSPQGPVLDATLAGIARSAQVYEPATAQN